MPSAFGDITGHRHQCQQNASGREAPKQNDGKTFFTTRPRDWQGRNTLYFLWWAKSPCGISMKEPRETLITFPFQFRTVQKPVQLKVVTLFFSPTPKYSRTMISPIYHSPALLNHPFLPARTKCPCARGESGGCQAKFVDIQRSWWGSFQVGNPCWASPTLKCRWCSWPSIMNKGLTSIPVNTSQTRLSYIPYK
jgi:hypothetical protein